MPVGQVSFQFSPRMRANFLQFTFILSREALLAERSGRRFQLLCRGFWFSWGKKPGNFIGTSNGLWPGIVIVWYCLTLLAVAGHLAGEVHVRNGVDIAAM
jgi:hypothetical protein